MKEQMFVKPAQGLKVVNPATLEPLPETGAQVPRSPYWLRRLRDGDVAAARRPAKAKTEEK